MEKIRPEQVVLYHGTLEELNQISGESRYKIPEKNLEFMSKTLLQSPQEELTTLKLREEILGKGFHGLVNRTTFYTGNDSKGNPQYRIEGTPIVFT